MGNFDSIRFRAGRPLTRELGAERLNAILAEIKRNKPKGERGITVRQDGTGTYIGLAAALPKRGTSTPATPQPWDLIARVDPDADTEDETPPYLVTVRPGTLNGFLPTNWDEEFECAGTGLHYAKAVITTDGQSITEVAIAIDTQEPSAQEPTKFALQESIEYTFGLFAEGSVYRTIGPGSITLTPDQWLVAAADPSAEAGEPTYDIYYKLD